MNSNEHLPTTREAQTARFAGGLSIYELRIDRPRADLNTVTAGRWYDPITELWIPDGVALLRPRQPKRDRLAV